MARPRSEDKRNAILAAAIAVMAEQGLGAPTAKIAKEAGVAEGTLFTYFATKDVLLNDLYVDLKVEMSGIMLATYPAAASLRDRARHIWQQYVAWGVAFPHKRKIIAQLAMSDRVSEHSKMVGMQTFAQFSAVIDDSLAQGVLRSQPAPFVGAVMAALAEATMDFIGRFPAQADSYNALGFEAFWNAVAEK